MHKKIFVTRPAMPNLNLLLKGLAKLILSRTWTNDGPFVKSFESQLAKLWNVKHVVSMANGTMPLLFLASRFPKGSKVLTTPFSFVATSSSLILNGLEIGFVDIDSNTLTPPPAAVRKKLLEGTYSGMLFTHVYGKNCDIGELEELAREFGVPLYFDASHSFGVRYEGDSVFSRGGASTTSFHATKLLSAGEGGALITNDSRLADAARVWRNFGISDGALKGLGLNAKMTEFSALLGLSNLKGAFREIRRREKLSITYKESLSGAKGIEFVSSPNYSYQPVIFDTEKALLHAVEALTNQDVYPRRYFYPSLNTLDFSETISSMPNSEAISKTILCLPMGTDVTINRAKSISRALEESNFSTAL